MTWRRHRLPSTTSPMSELRRAMFVPRELELRLSERFAVQASGELAKVSARGRTVSTPRLGCVAVWAQRDHSRRKVLTAES
jgi:hypothetical protein